MGMEWEEVREKGGGEEDWDGEWEGENGGGGEVIVVFEKCVNRRSDDFDSGFHRNFEDLSRPYQKKIGENIGVDMEGVWVK